VSATGVDAVVSSEHLSKWYGQVIGLNDVTVAVPSGITGLLGPNGAGKSTFMKLITGQLKPSKGGVTVLGEPIWGNPSAYFRIGFCPEQDRFYERMTGREWVTALVGLNGITDAAAKDMAARALETVGLTDVADKKIAAYSKGMRQRVKLAQALAHDPELLILDEPLSGMDPLVRRKTIRMIKDWGRAGKSIIVSSHILHEIESMTSNILLINQGRILAEGNVHQDQMGLLGLGLLDPLGAVDRADDGIAAALETALKHVPIHLIVLDDQYLFHSVLICFTQPCSARRSRRWIGPAPAPGRSSRRRARPRRSARRARRRRSAA